MLFRSPTTIRTQIRQADENLRAAEERLRMLKAGFRTQEVEEGRANLRQAQGGRGVKAAVKATGPARIREYDFKTSEQRYRDDLAKARTPQEQAAVKQKHEVMATRDEMHQKQEAARREADEMVRKNGGTNPDGTVKTDPKTAKVIEQARQQCAPRRQAPEMPHVDLRRIDLAVGCCDRSDQNQMLDAFAAEDRQYFGDRTRAALERRIHGAREARQSCADGGITGDFALDQLERHFRAR